ncbi:hypothetical protein EBQ74_12845 [bacterium]|nr:hypothetical protein [bacterium]
MATKLKYLCPQILRGNTSAAYSQIRDADIAHETSELTKYNILSQAGAAILAQANSTPN